MFYTKGGGTLTVDGASEWKLLTHSDHKRVTKSYKLQNANNSKSCLTWGGSTMKVTSCNIATSFELKEGKLVAGRGKWYWRGENRKSVYVKARLRVGFGFRLAVEGFDEV